MKLTYERRLMSGTITASDFGLPTNVVELDTEQNEFVTKAINLLFGDFLLKHRPSPEAMHDVLEDIQMIIDNYGWAHSPEVMRAPAASGTGDDAPGRE